MARQRDNLPKPLGRMIGRDETVRSIADHVRKRRFVSIVAAGGMGKSTVAAAVAAGLAGESANGARLVDFAATADPHLVTGALATVLELHLPTDRPLASLAAHLRDMDILIVLDTCEVQIAAVAEMAEALVRDCPGVRLLATSREPLRAAGEWVYRLNPLDVPAGSAQLTAREAISYPGVELFVERASSRLTSFAVSDLDAPYVSSICRQLDGIPLAIELAAAHVPTFGVRGLAARLESSFQLLPLGRRTAESRHQTLNATLDWSYGLLSVDEQVALRRLSVFRGRFDMDSAIAVIADAAIPAATALECVFALISKSLLSVDISDKPASHRLLDMTRSYALARLLEADGSDAVRRRHATIFLDLMRTARDDLSNPLDVWLRKFGPSIDDVRAALDWAFSEGGDVLLAAELTAAASVLAQRLYLPQEFKARTRQAIARLAEAGIANAAIDVTLQTYLSDFIYQTEGTTTGMQAAVAAAHAAGRLPNDAGNEPYYQSLASKWSFAINSGGYTEAVETATALFDRASASQEPQYLLLGRRMMAQALHFAGDHRRAQPLAEEVLASPIANMPLSALDKRVSMRIVLSRLAWMTGYPDDAERIAGETLILAQRDGVGATCQTLAFAVCAIAFWRGDTATARRSTDLLIASAETHGLPYWRNWATGFETAQWHLDNPGEPGPFESDQSIGLPADPMQMDHLVTICDGFATKAALDRIDAGAVAWNTPEVIRAWGETMLRSAGEPGWPAAETLFRRALRTAGRQASLSWELRAATSLARLLCRQGRFSEARDTLAPVYARFTEGFATVDLARAAKLLNELRTVG